MLDAYLCKNQAVHMKQLYQVVFSLILNACFIQLLDFVDFLTCYSKCQEITILTKEIDLNSYYIIIHFCSHLPCYDSQQTITYCLIL